jgi:hypothetical protein
VKAVLLFVCARGARKTTAAREPSKKPALPVRARMHVHTLPPKGARRTGGGAGGGGAPVASCSCKPNADGRCCSSKACGCTRGGLGCSPACHCRGFKLVCANPSAPLAAPAPKPDERPAKAAKKGGAGGVFLGAPRRLADDPFAIAAAQRDRSAFLAQLEAQTRADAEVAAAAAADDAAAAAPPPSPPWEAPAAAPHAPPQPRAAPAAAAGAGGAGEVIDLCDDSDEDVPVAAARQPPLQAARAPQLAAPQPRADPPPRAVPVPPPPARAPPRPAPPPPPRAAPAPVPSYDPFNPPQYVPAGGFKLGGELRVRESARLQTVDGAWMGGLTAVLDTGNEVRRAACGGAAVSAAA